jgi:hypothetical protein
VEYAQSFTNGLIPKVEMEVARTGTVLSKDLRELEAGNALYLIGWKVTVNLNLSVTC